MSERLGPTFRRVATAVGIACGGVMLGGVVSILGHMDRDNTAEKATQCIGSDQFVTGNRIPYGKLKENCHDVKDLLTDTGLMLGSGIDNHVLEFPSQAVFDERLEDRLHEDMLIANGLATLITAAGLSAAVVAGRR